MNRFLVALAGMGWAWLLLLAILGLVGLPVMRHHFESAGLAFGAGLLLLAIGGLPASPSRGTPRAPSVNVGAALIPALLGALAFSWTIGLGPLSDDYVLAEWARTGDWTPSTWPYARPLPLWIWHAVGSRGGSWPTLHAFNVGVHAVNAGLVCVLAQRRLGVRGGVAAATLFALFPASVEAVAWNAGVFDLTSTLFVLVALLCAPAVSSSALAAGAFLLACAGALLCKEIAVVIPALLVLDVCCSDDRLRRLRASLFPLVSGLLLVAGYALVRALSSSAVGAHLANMPDGRRQWKDVLVRPFASLAVPLRTDDGLGPEHLIVGLAALVLLGVALSLVWPAQGDDDTQEAAGSLQALSFGASWVVVTALPLLLQFYVSPTLEGSRYTYLPSVGFVIALTTAAGSTRSRWRSVISGLALIALLASYARGIGGERTIWARAAVIRDAVLQQAAQRSRETGCRTLTIADAPDNHRGAYVFREGLAIALRSTPTVPSGVECRWRWDDGTLQDDRR